MTIPRRAMGARRTAQMQRNHIQAHQIQNQVRAQWPRTSELLQWQNPIRKPNVELWWAGAYSGQTGISGTVGPAVNPAQALGGAVDHFVAVVRSTVDNDIQRYAAIWGATLEQIHHIAPRLGPGEHRVYIALYPDIGGIALFGTNEAAVRASAQAVGLIYDGELPELTEQLRAELWMLRQQRQSLWECWLRRRSEAVEVKIHGGGVIGVYQTLAGADAEKGADVPWRKLHLFECWVRKPSRATRVKLHDGGIIGVYNTLADAAAEASPAHPVPWEKPAQAS